MRVYLLVLLSHHKNILGLNLLSGSLLYRVYMLSLSLCMLTLVLQIPSTVQKHKS